MKDTELETVFIASRPELIKFVRKLTRDTSVAEDIVQRVFIKVWRNRQNIYPDQIFSLFCKMSRRMVLDDWKKITTRRKYDHLFIQDDKISSSQEEYILVNQVANSLGEMKPKYRDALLSMTLENNSQTEAAEKLNISTGTLRSRIGRAREKLREKFQ